MSFLCGAQTSVAQLRYDKEYPALDYSNAALSDSVTALMEAIAEGSITLDHTEEHGYLVSLLKALDIDPSSQLLVYSQTALKKRFVNAETPRALYFNDNTYIAYIQNSRSLEISAMDPDIGSVFFILPQDPKVEVDFDRQMNRCLRCHDSYSLSGDGVPRFLLSSVLSWPDGTMISHEFSTITDTSTPIDRRWGGWFVTGTHGEQEHMGNLLVTDVAMLSNLDLSSNGNKTDLSDIVNVKPYISPYSDIVALLVLEHQIEVQNRIIKANYKIRTILDEAGSVTNEQVWEYGEPLVQSLLMVNEAPFSDPIKGVSGFTEYFQQLGPMDNKGRSFRELDLNARVFKYPLSYQIYSDAFAALPTEVLIYVYKRLNEILKGEDQSEQFSGLSTQDRSDILEILRDTKSDFPDI